MKLAAFVRGIAPIEYGWSELACEVSLKRPTHAREAANNRIWSNPGVKNTKMIIIELVRKLADELQLCKEWGMHATNRR